MKTQKKRLFAPIGLSDGMKNTRRKWKPVMAMLLVVVMLFSMMPVTTIAASSVSYNLWVGGVRVTSGNASNITGSGISGTVTYDHATKTLTLNNATITGHYNNTGILTNTQDLTVRLIGDNIVAGQYNSGNSNYGMYIKGTLTFTGDGSLAASAEETTNANSWTVAILATGDITVERGCTITATSKPSNKVSAPILPYNGGHLIVTGSKVTPSTDISGTPLVTYNENALRTYKYMKIEPAPITYTVSFDGNGGTGTMADATGISGDYTLPANGFTAPSGKQFKAWSVDGAEKAVGDNITVTANTTVKAVWEDVPTYTVSFDGNGALSGSMAPVTGVSGEYTLPANDWPLNGFYPATNMCFAGWLVDGTVKAPGDKITVTSDITLKAHWEQEDYGITVGGVKVTYHNASDVLGDGTVSYDHATNTLTLNNATIYSAYSGFGTLTSAISNDNYNGSLTIRLIGNNTVYGDLSGGPAPSSHRYAIYASGLTSKLTFEGNGSLKITASEADGGSFYYGICCGDDVTVKEDCTITIASAHGSVLSFFDGELIADGSTVLASTSATGTPLAAYGELGARSKYVKILPAYNVTVSFDANGGTGTMADQTVVCASEYTLPANGFTAPAGKLFKAWSVNGAERAVGDKVYFVANTTVTALWADIPAGHTCSIQPVSKVKPTCTENGKEAHYKCDGCGKFFEDVDGTTEITNIAAWGILTKLDHTEGSVWKSDKDNHWHVCSAAGCGAVIDGSKAAHTPDRTAATETDPVKCSVCGYEIAPVLAHTHTHGTEWKSDKDNHWMVCACGDKANVAAHKDENKDGKCDTCAYNVGTPATPADPDIPQTSDNSMLWLWIALLLISGFGVVTLSSFGKKKYSLK